MNIKNLVTFSGVIAITIATSYMVRTYLDYLRIKAIKKDLKQHDEDNELK
tara:strand:+ start:176 stop:325 length:150 start_codon:yes stop_codon:yes gene_type:complete